MVLQWQELSPHSQKVVDSITAFLCSSETLLTSQVGNSPLLLQKCVDLLCFKG